MGKYDSLLKTSFSKKTCSTNAEQLYIKAHLSGDTVDYEYFENLNILDLQEHNKKKKYNIDLVTLWAKLEMKSFIDYQLGNTINPYFLEKPELVPIKDLPNYTYMRDESRLANLLDIKYIKTLTLQGITFSNIYMATCEIMDPEDKFCPLIKFFTKDMSTDSFTQFAYGYDSNKNNKIELFIDSFNYPVLLNNKGFIELPLSGVRKKLDVYDYITDNDIAKLLSKK